MKFASTCTISLLYFLVYCGPAQTDVRLVNGPHACAGRVEIYDDGSWWTVCDDVLDLPDAQVVCRQLGCGTALSAKSNAFFGPGVGNIWKNTIICSGHESSLSQCSHSRSGSFYCAHSEDVGVVCEDNRPVLSVSPPWLSPGVSVTLSCEVKGSSADWSFYWYRAVPKPSHNNYMYEPKLLPGSLHGTVKGSFIIHDPTGTGGYVCEAGRGDPVYYTRYSEPQFVWSGDAHSSGSLTVSSNRTQHFFSEHHSKSYSVRCEGKSTEWRLKWYPDHKTIIIRPGESVTTVFWCESGLGEYSNAVNITIHDGPVILVSPVHPVAEGHEVTLRCKHRTHSSLSNVDFYRNEEPVQTNTNGEMIIPAVSESDEGFYKCNYSGGESPQSWMAVRVTGSTQPSVTGSQLPVTGSTQPSVTGSQPPVTVAEQSSPHVVWLIVGLVVILLLTVLLLLLYRYRTSKNPCCVRSVRFQGTNQHSGADQRTNRQGSPDGHSPLQHYEAAAESGDVTYSEIELKHMGKRKNEKPADPFESSLYSEVKTGSHTAADVTYAQVNYQNKDRNKKAAPEQSEDTVYSQVKAGTSLGL